MRDIAEMMQNHMAAMAAAETEDQLNDVLDKFKEWSQVAAPTLEEKTAEAIYLATVEGPTRDSLMGLFTMLRMTQAVLGLSLSPIALSPKLQAAEAAKRAEQNLKKREQLAAYYEGTGRPEQAAKIRSGEMP